ncbi:unnamed protein product, partial [Choristocarpus tenellus]
AGRRIVQQWTAPDQISVSPTGECQGCGGKVISSRYIISDKVQNNKDVDANDGQGTGGSDGQVMTTGK